MMEFETSSIFVTLLTFTAIQPCVGDTRDGSFSPKRVKPTDFGSLRF